MNEEERTYETAEVTLRLKWETSNPRQRHPEKWDWDQLLDLSNDEEVEVIFYEVVA